MPIIPFARQPTQLRSGEPSQEAPLGRLRDVARPPRGHHITAARPRHLRIEDRAATTTRGRLDLAARARWRSPANLAAHDNVRYVKLGLARGVGSCERCSSRTPVPSPPRMGMLRSGHDLRFARRRRTFFPACSTFSTGQLESFQAESTQAMAFVSVVVGTVDGCVDAGLQRF